MSHERLQPSRAVAALAFVLALAAPAAGQPTGAPGSAAGDPERRDVPVPEDLFAVITLRGKPCGKVVRHERRSETDYLVECQDGHRYRVYVTEGDRVVVEER